MIESRKYIEWVSKVFGLFAVVLMLSSLCLTLLRPSDIPVPIVQLKKTMLPKNSFLMSQKDYESIACTAFSLKSAPPSMQLPDLRQHLTYYGTNGRPDAIGDKTMLHFALANNKSVSAVSPGDKLYLLYDKKQTPAKYVFSPQNAETSLWFEAVQDKNEAIVKVSMRNEQGEVVHEPASYAEFSLAEKEFARIAGGNWEIGKFRVDGSLLARQRARWYGEDLFLEKHGGDEFEIALGRQRIDFGEEEEAYSCFVSQGENLVWDGSQWKGVAPGEDTRNKPLLHVKKADERLMTFELWDNEGKGKIVLNLLKSSEPWTPQNIEKDFKFIGARTRTQCAFEINQGRMILKPQDWLLLTEAGWKKLTTPEEVDEYVNRKAIGTLFVFDGLVKKDDKQMLVGTMYNASRTESHAVEMAVQQSNVSVVPVPDLGEGKKGDHQARVLLPKRR